MVIDGDAVYSAADTLVISTQVDGVVPVVRAEDTRWEVAQAAVQRLSQAGSEAGRQRVQPTQVLHARMAVQKPVSNQTKDDAMNAKMLVLLLLPLAGCSSTSSDTQNMPVQYPHRPTGQRPGH